MNTAERETLLSRWAAPPSDTEDERAENARRVISDVLRARKSELADRVTIFVQGSYRNNTNVRFDSDVDICVRLDDVFTTDYYFAPNLSDTALGFVTSTYTHSQFKSDVGGVLTDAFGGKNVTRGNKAFRVHANSYRVNADVVPCFRHLRYEANGGRTEGTSLFPDSGARITNFPEQHFANGVAKNNRTGYAFKRTVRIMKNLRNRMAEEGDVYAIPIPSFLNECLVWNTPDALLTEAEWSDVVRRTLIHLWSNLQSDESDGEQWGQVSELLYLFRGPNSFSREQAKGWILAAWNRLEYQ